MHANPWMQEIMKASRTLTQPKNFGKQAHNLGNDPFDVQQKPGPSISYGSEIPVEISLQIRGLDFY